MEKRGWYIGTPNGVVVCVNSYNREAERMGGCFFHGYQEEAVEFSSVDTLLRGLEHFYDEINFPHPATTLRTFGEGETLYHRRQEREKMQSDEELLRKHGDLGTFIVRVQHRQNSSWQGRITWMEEDKTVYFRSIWEMIKLVESALDSVGAESENTEATWGDE